MQITAEIISIGTELLLGDTLNTNAAYLSQRLAELGIDLYYQTTVGDNPSRLAESLLRSLGRADIVITTGGLGPTVDDITVETICRIIHKRPVPSKAVLRDLNRYFSLRGLKTPLGSKRQCLVPPDATCLRNSVGTAAGLIIVYKEKRIIALPGPPRELIPMFEDYVTGYLIKHFNTRQIILSRLVKTTGLAESEVNHELSDLLKMGPATTVGIYAKLGEVDLKITAKAKDIKSASRKIAKVEDTIRRRIKDYIFGYDDETLEEAVGKILTKKKKTIAAAESCTGGLVANRLTDVSGSSKYFTLGLTAYSNASKVNLLGVKEETIERYGAVSPQAAQEMAKGVRLLAGADAGVGITGIAGPTGGGAKKPIGLVYIALVTASKNIVRELRFKGSRGEIKFQASQAALDMIRRFLSLKERGPLKLRVLKKAIFTQMICAK